jgi:hypothetical protein
MVFQLERDGSEVEVAQSLQTAPPHLNFFDDETLRVGGFVTFDKFQEFLNFEL